MPNQDNIITDVEKLAAVADAGFALAFHLEYTRPAILFQSYPDAWIGEYSQKGMVMSDPTVHWGFENTGIKRWSDLTDVDKDGILVRAATFGLNYGLTCACELGDSRSICSFASSNREFTDDEAQMLLATVQTLHEATRGVPKIDASMRKNLEKIKVKVSQPS